MGYTNNNMVMMYPAWRLMNKFVMYKGCQIFDFINSRYFEQRVVYIPSNVRDEL